MDGLTPKPPDGPEGTDNSPVGRAFPTDPAEFGNDERCSFSKPDDAWLMETEDGEEYLWNDKLKRWVRQIDEELLHQQQLAYKIDGVDETEATHPRDRKKRKKEADENEAPKTKKPRVNTAVWVTKIPLDAQKQEIRELFAKYGVIAEAENGDPRIKMYTGEDGNFTGEALVVYFRPESVQLAIQMLDETEFRLGVTGPDGPMRVEVADSSYKAQKLDADESEKPKLSKHEKLKIQERNQRLNSKLADWDDDDIPPVIKKPNHNLNVVILKHMFTLRELKDDPSALLDIKEDIREECSKLGEVTNVVLYDLEPEGVVTVRFKDPAAAALCVQKMRGRRFSGTAVEAYVSDVRLRFRKSRGDGGDGAADDDEDDEEERLQRFGDWLEGGNAPSK